MKVNVVVITFFLITCFFHCVYGNTEKLILEVRKSDPIVCDEKLFELEKYQTAPRLLAPFTEVQSELIPKSKANKATSNWYHLDNLKEGSNYEIRISYPAITPADFKLNIIQHCLVDDKHLYLLQVTANYTGVSRIKDIDHQPVKYNIVMENLYFGFLFYQVYKIVISISVVLILGQFVFIPYVKKLIKSKIE